MVAVGIDDAARLTEQVLVDDLTATEGHAMVGPRGSLGLQVYAHAVGSSKGGLGGTIGMEADVVEPVLTALEEDARPRGLVDRWIAGLGEAAVLDCAAQPYRLTVEQELTTTDGDVANAEGNGERLAAVDEGAGVEIGVGLAPEAHAVAQQHLMRGTVDHDGDLAGGNIGDDADDGARDDSELDAPGNAVPVALRLVGDAVGILSHADVLDAVIDIDGNGVGAPGTDEVCDIVLMGRGERQLAAHAAAVDIDSGLDMGPLEEEHHATATPRTGHADGAAIPGMAHIVGGGREEERELDVALEAVLLHVGIEIVGRVVGGACPYGMCRDGVALAVGEHGAGQGNVVVIMGSIAHGEIPAAGEVDSLLCEEGAAEEPCDDGREQTGKTVHS